MAIYHFSVKPIGRGSGRSAVGASAYRSGEKIRNEYDGIIHDYSKRRGAVGSSAYRSGGKLYDGVKTYDYTRKREIIHSEIMLPSHAPKEYINRSTLWNAVEKSEKANNARTAREIVVALPNELTQEQNIQLVRDYVQRNFVDSGMCADVNIHAGHIHEKKDEKYPFDGLTIRQDNPHAHIMLTVRPIDKNGAWGAKSKKEYILDRNSEKIILPSGNYKSRKIDTTDWDKTATLEKWREDWARTVNKEFERLDISERIDHRTLKAQGIDRESTVHMGHKAWNLEKKGVDTERGNINREIYKRNKAKNPEYIAEKLYNLKEQYFNLEKEITEIQEISDETKREMNISRFRAEEITERAEQIQTMKSRLDELKNQRENISIFNSKNDVDRKIQQVEYSHEQAISYFERQYKIAPEQAGAEIKRLELKAESKRHFQEQLQDKLKPLIEQRELTIFEYQRQKLLVDVRADKDKIYERLEVLECESRVYKGLVRDDVLRLRCEKQLDTITERNFGKITKELQPEQRENLLKLRERERVKNYIMYR